MITLEIATDNAAFDGEDIGPEVARVLRNLRPTASSTKTGLTSAGALKGGAFA